MRRIYVMAKQFSKIQKGSCGENISNLRAIYNGLGKEICNRFPNTSIIDVLPVCLILEIEEEDVDGIRTLFTYDGFRSDTPMISAT